ncbi:MAG: globin family protein [Opitutus sp.]
MTAHEIKLVQTSFKNLAPIADQAAALFYARLFELDPSLRQLFHGDMETQGRKLMQMIGMAVGSLDRIDEALPMIRDAGARHSTYGVRDDHYATVGCALLWTLEKGLGAEFTTEVKSAWTATYTLIANTMKAGARASVAAA